MLILSNFNIGYMGFLNYLRIIVNFFIKPFGLY